jgi:hypothetical protein
MATCQAITQNGFYPCGNPARQGHDTCGVHKTFFHKRGWFKKFILGENKSQDVALLGYDQRHSVTGRLTEHVRKVLQSGRIKITEEDIRCLPCSASMVDVFLILCELPHVDPKWNKRFVVEAVRTYFYRIIGYNETLRNYNPYKVQDERLGPLLKNPNMGFDRTLKFMIAVKEMRSLGRLRLMNQPEAYFDDVFSTLFLDYNDDYSLYAPEALTSLMVPEGAKADYFQAKVIPLLKRRQKQIKLAKKMRMAPLKEEIVSVVYHPDNVERWLNTRGWGFLDMMF